MIGNGAFANDHAST